MNERDKVIDSIVKVIQSLFDAEVEKRFGNNAERVALETFESMYMKNYSGTQFVDHALLRKFIDFLSKIILSKDYLLELFAQKNAKNINTEDVISWLKKLGLTDAMHSIVLKISSEETGISIGDGNEIIFEGDPDIDVLRKDNKITIKSAIGNLADFKTKFKEAVGANSVFYKD